MLAAQGITRLKAEDRTIDGRPGKVFRGKKGKHEIIVGAVMHDQSLVTVAAGLDEGQDDRTLIEVLDSLDLDGIEITDAAESVAAHTRDVMTTEADLDPLELFDHVYARPRPALLEQRARLEAELAEAAETHGNVAASAGTAGAAR